MSPENVAISQECNTKQEARAKLRENFLMAINELHGQPMKVLTYEQSTLQATFSEWKIDGSEVIVKDLETPAGIKMTSALLRIPDILAIHFENPIKLP